MRHEHLPTQLIFSLRRCGSTATSNVVALLNLSGDGDVVYLTDEDVTKAEAIKDSNKRNREFANVELRHKTGNKHEQIYRHILANLDDAHLKKDPSALKHLEKGHVAGMTKAASYLLTFDDFAKMRQYVIDHVDWMVSDSTGLPPKYGEPAGHVRHTAPSSPNMPAGASVAPAYKRCSPTSPSGARFVRHPDGAPQRPPRYHGAQALVVRLALVQDRDRICGIRAIDDQARAAGTAGFRVRARSQYERDGRG